MNFQSLLKVEDPDFYLGLAFRNANAAASKARSKLRGKQIERSRKVELEKLDTVRKVLVSQMKNIVKSFPNLKELPDFYQELVKCTLDYEMLRKSLGGVMWASEKVENLHAMYRKNVRTTQDFKKINSLRRQFYGRVSSVLNQIRKELMVIEESRRVMKEFPAVKTSIFTATITGFPNVGKTTLLYRLTGSKPEINNYPFTTRSINISYIKHDSKKIQLIDTPGTLNRFNKMNAIEKQAYLALKHCSDLIIYVFDPTESYPVEKQKKLLLKIKEYKKPIITYLSKSDLVNEEVNSDFRKRFKVVTDAEELKARIIEASLL